MKYMVDEEVNIDECPQKNERPGVTEVTIGDLHANAIKFLYFLIRHGIYTVTSENYLRLVCIYKTEYTELTKAQLEEFEDLLSTMQVIPNTILVRLIGDELADRGSNDYFVLKILEKLHHDNVRVEILLSNHGLEFIEAYERYPERKKFEATVMLNHTPSLKKMAYLIEKQLVKAEEILSIVHLCYKPKLKIISYSLDLYEEEEEEGITIHSHAAIDLNSVLMLALQFDIPYRDTTRLELKSTIDNINQFFRQYVRNNNIHRLYDVNELKNGYTKKLLLTKRTAVEYIVWNRDCRYLDRPEQRKNYRLFFVHGHDSADSTFGNICNLESKVGKTPEDHFGNYRSLSCDELPHFEPIPSPFAGTESLLKWCFFNPLSEEEELCKMTSINHGPSGDAI